MPGSFFDTNILIYLASDDAAKANRAEAIVREGGTVSIHVLNEVAIVARRKMKLTWQETRGFLSSLRELLTVQLITVDKHELGSRWRNGIISASMTLSLPLPPSSPSATGSGPRTCRTEWRSISGCGSSIHFARVADDKHA